MEYKITESAFAPIANIRLNKGQSIKLERGGMIMKSQGVEIKGKMNGKGLFSAIGRALTSGESFFITEAESNEENGFVVVGPHNIGKVFSLECGTKQWVLNDGAFVASDNTIEYKMNRQKNLGGALIGRTGGLFNMETSGHGTVIVNSYGDVIEYDLDGQVTIDNGHVVAWENSINYSPKIASGMFGFTTGEGIVLEFSGRGKVYIATRNLQGTAESLIPFLPIQTNVN